MRPNKKGLWLFKISHDELRAINIDENLRTALGDSIEQFESIFEGFEWLGQVHPPKKVDRYIMETVYGSGGPTTESAMEKYQTGAWVRYEDVKEYLID